uniref:Uncharacterized protein n=1 Tax=Amphimedon queenslandica TaxID=400682 RepID=A0A1X7U2R2_AMPQE
MLTDIKAVGFWNCSRERAFFDGRIFNPTEYSCCNQSLYACYDHHELEKRHLYEDTVILVENRCCTPLVFLTSGGIGPLLQIL